VFMSRSSKHAQGSRVEANREAVLEGLGPPVGGRGSGSKGAATSLGMMADAHKTRHMTEASANRHDCVHIYP
jgi:hypothetical protein